MFIDNLVANLRERSAKRKQYNRLVAEIQSLSPRDLSDMRADRGDMLRHAYRQVYR